MIERALQFGAHHGLVGVLCEPAAGDARSDIAVIVSNVGMHHRVGPFRMYVELARALAAIGVPVLRFDLSGMGDSAPRNDAATPEARAAKDLDDAMQVLGEVAGATRFVLIGLCSGVNSSFDTAKRDPRVIGAVFVDGYSYPTQGYFFRRYVVRPLQLRRWLRYLSREKHREYRIIYGPDTPSVLALESPTEREFVDGVAAMTRRGARLLFVFSGGVESRNNSPKQLFEVLGDAVDRRLIAVTAMFEADHIFANTRHRAELIQTIRDWMQTLPQTRSVPQHAQAH